MKFLAAAAADLMAILPEIYRFKSQDGKVILIRLGPSRVELVYSKMVLKIAILWPPQSLVHYYIYTMI